MYHSRYRQVARLNYTRAKRRRRKVRRNFESLLARPRFTAGRKKEVLAAPRLSTVVRRRRIAATAWLLSLVLNAFILLWVAMLPTPHPVVESAIQVAVVSLPNPSPLKRRKRPHRQIAAVDMDRRNPINRRVAAVPLRTGSLATQSATVVHSPARVSLNPVAETEFQMNVELSADAVSQPNLSVSSSPIVGRMASEGKVIAPSRAAGILDKIQSNAGNTAQVEVRGSGREITGYYNIVVVQYEDAADAIRAQALNRLVYAMNRWTKVRTQLLPDTMPLASPDIHHIPLVYVAARDAFTFSETERANLRTYLQSGGTLLFSDISTAWGIEGPVANSIRFEVWKIIGQTAHFVPINRKDAVCRSFFEFKKGAPRVVKKRGEFYALRLNGRTAVYYDAAGIGLKWGETSENEKWLEWGVNLIVHTIGDERHPQ